MNFDEYRLLVQPDVSNVGQWTIHVQKAPRPDALGPKLSTTPIVKEADLAYLRNPTAPQDLTRLRKIGQDVFNSLLPVDAQAELKFCLTDARNAQKGLRIVVSILGNKRAPGMVGCHEIPVEALFAQHLNFLATDVATPISRGVTVEADRPAVKVAPPLRILVVISEPSDMPPVQGNVEKQAIQAALGDLMAAGAVQLDFCTPPTAATLDALLQQQSFHVVHFIGHGDFDSESIDPQPYLYFEDGTPQRKRRAVDAEQMYTMLRNGNVPLVVMTACSSAASQPNGAEYPVLAFEGFAQTLVQRTPGPLAVVGMQFDLETAAASVFSKTLYRQLLTRDMSIDVAVAAARGALVTSLGAAHRSWVNPTVYWRCKDGRPFDLVPTTGTLTAQQIAELKSIDMTMAAYETALSDLKKESAASQQSHEVVAALALVRNGFQSKIEELMKSRGTLLGDTLRLRGGTIAGDGIVDCVLSLRIRTGARIGDIQANLAFDPTEFSYVGAKEGADILANSLIVQAPVNPGDPVTVFVKNASANNEWTAGEHTLVAFKFKALKNAAGKPLLRISLRNVTVSRDNANDPAFGALDAVVFAP